MVHRSNMSSDSSSNAGLSEALSSLNIGDGKMNNEEREATDNINTATILCAACGKERGDNNMNTCNKCDLAVYCNAACKKKHRPKHKKKCEKRAAELYDEKLFRENPPREECPICMLPLPLSISESSFESCCGKLICGGCIYSMAETGGKNMMLCPFCKTPNEISGDEEVKRLTKLMEMGNADAFGQLGLYYHRGSCGLRQDMAKANELWLKAGQLGCAQAYHNLGYTYEDGIGVEVDKKKAKHYYELAAMKGSIPARHNLGCLEGQAGNHQRAFKHNMLSARAGCNKSLNTVKGGYMDGIVTKDEYANTLREYQKSQDEMKSEARDKALAFIQDNYNM